MNKMMSVLKTVMVSVIFPFILIGTLIAWMFSALYYIVYYLKSTVWKDMKYVEGNGGGDKEKE